LNVIVNTNSMRYRVFKLKGLKCCSCELEGKFFALERHYKTTNPNKFHFNLYTIDKNGNEILMTKDHIIPIAKGGKNVLRNLQTMCQTCNSEKSNYLSIEEARKNTRLTTKKKIQFLPSIDFSEKIVGKKVCKKSGRKFKNSKIEAIVESIGIVDIQGNIIKAVKLKDINDTINVKCLVLPEIRKQIFNLKTKQDLCDFERTIS